MFAPASVFLLETPWRMELMVLGTGIIVDQ
jgi:hypothetical protein